jgi:O-antigen chain-terminating methyltransferase
MKDNFYRAFEDLHRGSRSLIKNRLSIYLPFIRPLLELYQPCNAVDLGCGRGEWMELLGEEGFKRLGVDLDEGMLDACQEHGIEAKQGDAIEFLKSLSEQSQAVVTGFHIAEHIPFNCLRELVVEAYRVLLPAGLLILETPNPENLFVGASSFYLDPTHQRPLPPELLKFLTEYSGFERSKILRLNNADISDEQEIIGLTFVLKGVSPDYSIVAQKKATKEILGCFDEFFNRHYGITLDDMVTKYEISNMRKIETIISEFRRSHEALQTQMLKIASHEEQLESKIIAECDAKQQLKSDISEFRRSHEALQTQMLKIASHEEQLESKIIAECEAKQQLKSELNIVREKMERLETDFHEANTVADNFNQQLQSVYGSYCWRITWPLRKIHQFIKWLSLQSNRFIYVLHVFLKKTAKSLLVIPMRWVFSHFWLKNRIDKFLMRFPCFRQRLVQIAETAGLVDSDRQFLRLGSLYRQENYSDLDNISAGTKNIYFNLKKAIEREKKKKY